MNVFIIRSGKLATIIEFQFSRWESNVRIKTYWQRDSQAF